MIFPHDFSAENFGGKISGKSTEPVFWLYNTHTQFARSLAQSKCVFGARECVRESDVNVYTELNVNQL